MNTTESDDASAAVALAADEETLARLEWASAGESSYLMRKIMVDSVTLLI